MFGKQSLKKYPSKDHFFQDQLHIANALSFSHQILSNTSYKTCREAYITYRVHLMHILKNHTSRTAQYKKKTFCFLLFNNQCITQAV